MRLPEYDRLDATALAGLVRGGQLSATELLEAALDRIDTRDPALGAVVRRRDEAARREAAELADGLRRRNPALLAAPFPGVPLLVKDLVATLAGEPTGSGNRVLAGCPRPLDSTFVRRLRAAGLVPVGRTATPEFGLMPTTEPEGGSATRNPWAPGRSPGGSSGGSAAAVAARIVPIATGGDGGGSIRVPASCCGLFGFKPSRGLVPVGPELGEVWAGLVTEHALTRSVRDSAALLDAVAGADAGAPYAAPSPVGGYAQAAARAEPGVLRVAFTARPLAGPADTDAHPHCRAALAEAAALLESLGHEVEEAAPPVDPAALSRDFVTVLAGHVAATVHDMALLLGRRVGPADLEPGTWSLALVGRSLSAAAYVQALERLRLAARAMAGFFEAHDLLLTPVLSRPPVALGELRLGGAERVAAQLTGRLHAGGLLRAAGILETVAARTFGYMAYTPLFNVTGQPAMSVPLHWSPDGLPIGVQLAGRLGDDARLFALAAQLERARPWADRRPPGLD